MQGGDPSGVWLGAHPHSHTFLSRDRFVCFRQKGKPKRKSRYKILDATDQESLELKPTSRAGRTVGAGAEGQEEHRHHVPHTSMLLRLLLCFLFSGPVVTVMASRQTPDHNSLLCLAPPHPSLSLGRSPLPSVSGQLLSCCLQVLKSS